ncbi:MAG: LytR C-terminal domain-containing protein [Candidatus Cloacimonetes bacterium]|nr:LytR C-terminal domain-containing protein [Candidatus Cloacimonadota bacterium]
MTKKNLTENPGKSQNGMQLFFVLALLIMLIYIFYPYKQPQQEANDLPKPEIYIVVLNGCGIANIAQEVSKQLLDQGVNAMTWGNTDNPNCIHQKTQIVVRQESENQAAKLAYLQKVTGIKEFIIAHKENSLTEFELILGKDYINYFKK